MKHLTFDRKNASRLYARLDSTIEIYLTPPRYIMISYEEYKNWKIEGRLRMGRLFDDGYHVELYDEIFSSHEWWAYFNVDQGSKA